MNKIKDSGQRRTFSTGSVRDCAQGKGRFDLLPAWALEEVAKHFEAGADKYGERNWEKGQPLSKFLDSALRHLAKVLRGDTDEPHDRAAAWNVLCFLDTKRRIELGILPKELDDLPKQPNKNGVQCAEPNQLSHLVMLQAEADARRKAWKAESHPVEHCDCPICREAMAEFPPSSIYKNAIPQDEVTLGAYQHVKPVKADPETCDCVACKKTTRGEISSGAAIGLPDGQRLI
jgi:Domain of unknown function (DUF5664)